jgi:hypothetical protein
MYLVTRCHSVEARRPSNSDLPSILSTSQYPQTQVSSARPTNRPPSSKIRLSSPTKTSITIISTHTYILDLSQPLTALHVRTHHVISHRLITQPVTSQPPSFPSFLSLEFSAEMRIFTACPVLLVLFSVCEAGTTVSRPEPASALSGFLSLETAVSALSSASSTSTGSGKAMVTSPPELGMAGVLGLQEKWHLTTYWSCNVFDKTVTMCGW